MNPFQKLKLTIDRVGLSYIPSNDYPDISGQTVYKYAKNTQNQQSDDHVPYFKTGPNQSSFKQRSVQFMAEQIEQIKAVYQNQQKSYIQQINTLNKKIENLQKLFSLKSSQNQSLKDSLISQQRQNHQLRAGIIQIQQKNLNKLSQSGVHDRQRKLRQEIDRINNTVTELARDLNSQRTNRKNIQKQLESFKTTSNQTEQNFLREKSKILKQIQILKQELQKRTELLQHSIKSSRDEKVNHKQQTGQRVQKFEQKLTLIKQELDQSRQQNFQLKNTITEMKYLNQGITKQLQSLKNTYSSIKDQLNESLKRIDNYCSSQNDYKNKLQQFKLQIAYLNQQLEQERSNTRVKVVQVKDQSLQMQVNMYRTQCKQLLKERSIWQSVGKDKSQYTIISQNQILVNKSN